MILNALQVDHKINTQDYRVLIIYSGKLENREHVTPFETLTAETSEGLRDKFKQFVKIYDGEFTGVLKPSLSSKDTGSTILMFFFTTSENSVTITQPVEVKETLNGSRESIIKEIREDLKKEADAEKIQIELKELRIQVTKKADNQDRMFTTIRDLAMGFILPKDEFSTYYTAMNGIPEETTKELPMEGTTPIVYDQQELEKACVIIIEKLGEKPVINFARKLQAGLDPQMQVMLNAFINS